MIGSILATTDGSPVAGDALRWAGCLARLVGTDLTVLTVDSVRQADVTPELFEERGRELDRRLDGWIAAADVGEVKTVAVHRAGRPADVIEAEAEATGPDLVVAGARGGGGFTRLGLGSTTHQLAHSLRVPLAAIHGPSGIAAGSQIVVGVDGSRGSELALRWAADVASSLSCDITAVFVHDPMADSYPHPDLDNWKYLGEREAEQVVAEIQREFGRPVGFRMEAGNAVEELARVAETLTDPVVIVGTRSHGLVKSRLLGRVPMELLHHCPQPVILVPFR